VRAKPVAAWRVDRSAACAHDCLHELNLVAFRFTMICKPRFHAAAAVLVIGVACVLHAQGPVTRSEVYNCWYANREKDTAKAYQCARRLLEVFGADDDRYTLVVRKFVWEHDNPLLVEFEALFRALQKPADVNNPHSFQRFFDVGSQLLAQDPENLSVAMRVGYYAYVAALERHPYASSPSPLIAKVVTRIEKGAVPDAAFRNYPAPYKPTNIWVPFGSREHALASLLLAQGFLIQRERPADAANAFFHAAQFDTEVGRTPQVFYFLALAYDQSEWSRASREFNEARKVNAADTAPLARLLQVTDRLLSYYARVEAMAGNSPVNQELKRASHDRLVVLYKFSHDGSEDGLARMVAGSSAQRLVDPAAPLPTN
jgi:hypothetical protein